MAVVTAKKIVLGSRGSDLARAQAALVTAALREAWPELEISTQIISTSGDERTAQPIDPKAGRKGLFTREIEQALLAGTIDVAVHSAKDLPSEMLSELAITGVLRRAPVEDVLITKTPHEVPPGTGSVIATGSVRRQYQLRWKYAGIETVDLRGNVPTRLRKLVESDWAGIVLAGAGLRRLGYEIENGSFRFDNAELHARALPAAEFLPAGGQGIIALQTRSGDDQSRDLVRAVNDSDTFACLAAEREFLRLLEGDCNSPVGVLATVSGDALSLRAQIFDPPRIEPRVGRVEGSAMNGEAVARELWETING
jgi:hydroxymethylbilane synthase